MHNYEKAIHYCTLASNKNFSFAQFQLGLCYYTRDNSPLNIKKGIYYLKLAACNKCRLADFAYGFLLHEGKNVERNIEEAVHHYKETSSLNINYAKNNLRIIYKHGNDKIEKRIGNANELFNEAIKQKQ